MESAGVNSTDFTYRTVTVDGSANAHLGNTHNAITVQQYVFVLGHYPSNCAQAPMPATTDTTKPLYSRPRSERVALRPSPGPLLGTTSHIHKRRSPAAQHSGHALPAHEVARHHQHPLPTRPQLRHRRRPPLPKKRIDDRVARNVHSAELG